MLDEVLIYTGDQELDFEIAKDVLGLPISKTVSGAALDFRSRHKVTNTRDQVHVFADKLSQNYDLPVFFLMQDFVVRMQQKKMAGSIWRDIGSVNGLNSSKMTFEKMQRNMRVPILSDDQVGITFRVTAYATWASERVTELKWDHTDKDDMQRLMTIDIDKESDVPAVINSMFNLSRLWKEQLRLTLLDDGVQLW